MMGDFSTTQIAGVVLLVVSIGFVVFDQLRSFWKRRKRSQPSSGSVPTFASFQATINQQKMSYETALARIAKLESELAAIRHVVAQSPADEAEVTK